MRVALIDSDIIAYRSAILCEAETEDMAVELVGRLHQYWQDMSNADIVVPCLTQGPNFRRDHWPDYKQNRKKKERPRHLSACIEHILTMPNVAWMSGLEADDVIGILQTVSDHDTIIVTVDKDMDQIPGLHCNPDKEIIYDVSQDDADLYRWIQVLTGDSTDNYPGIPKVGIAKAQKMLNEVSPGDRMSVVKAVYESKELSLDYYHQMVACATILTYEDLCESSLPVSSADGTLRELLATVMSSKTCGSTAKASSTSG